MYIHETIQNEEYKLPKPPEKRSIYATSGRINRWKNRNLLFRRFNQTEFGEKKKKKKEKIFLLSLLSFS